MASDYSVTVSTGLLGSGNIDLSLASYSGCPGSCLFKPEYNYY